MKAILTNQHLDNAVRAFVSSFIVTAAGVISTAGTITWTESFWISVATTAVSVAYKALVVSYLSPTVNSAQK